MINHNDEAVLIDFGVSALVDETDQDMLDGNMGSYMFFAPEMFAKVDDTIKIRGELTDLWALGLTLFYMACG